MDDKTEVIRHNIEETRTSLTEKLETLEQQVVGTVQNTTNAVTDTVGSVKEAVQGTVDAVKDTVSSTVQTVKGTVRDTVEAVKDSLDISQHVRNYPWAMFGGSVAAGYLVGAYLIPSGEAKNGDTAAEAESFEAFEGPEYKRDTDGRARSNGATRQAAEERPQGQSTSGGFWGLLSGEFDKIRNLAIGTGLGFVRELIEKNVSGDLAQHLTKLVDDFNEKLGGEQVRGPFFKGESDQETSSERDFEMAGGNA
jgi:ElaB/YqjD/DUF883 family membrane-anchored ribosome-binding protein